MIDFYKFPPKIPKTIDRLQIADCMEIIINDLARYGVPERLSSCVSIRTRFGFVFLRHCFVKILANASAFTVFLPRIAAKTLHRKFLEPKTR